MAKRTIRHHSTGKASRSFSHDRSNVLSISDGKPEMSTKTRNLLNNIKGRFLTYVSEFEGMLQTKSELAPDFLKAFAAYQDETSGSFISFVRLIDETVPPDQKSYRNNSTYQAAVYLRRVAEGKQEAKKAIPASRRPATPLVALARLVATVLPMVDPTGSIFDAFVKEMHWSEEQGERLRVLAAREKAIPLAPRTIGAMRQRAIAVGE